MEEEYAVDLWLQQGKEGVTVLRLQQSLTWQLVEGMSMSLRAMLWNLVSYSPLVSSPELNLPDISCSFSICSEPCVWNLYGP